MSELLRRMRSEERRPLKGTSYAYDFTEQSVKDPEWLSMTLQRLQAEVKRLKSKRRR